MNANEERKCTLIDVDGIIRRRLPGYSRFLPRAVTRMVERAIRQDGLNRLLVNNAGKPGPEFCAGVLADLGVSYRLEGELPDADRRRVIYVSNHPLGGLDGIVLIDMIHRRHGGAVHFVVNDLLMAVEPLRDVFLPVNKHGRQSRAGTMSLEAAMAGDDPLIMFPAGLVSRRRNGRIADLPWNKMFVTKAIANRRDIVPLYFEGHNSSFFYNFARLREKTGLKFNIEMVRLPAEVFKAAGSRFTVHAGQPIAWQALEADPDRRHAAETVRRAVYSMAPSL